MDFLLIQETETQTLPFRKWFFVRKRESSQEENETWKAYTNGIWTINLSSDDPACINLCIQCIIIISVENEDPKSKTEDLRPCGLKRRPTGLKRRPCGLKRRPCGLKRRPTGLKRRPCGKLKFCTTWWINWRVTHSWPLLPGGGTPL